MAEGEVRTMYGGVAPRGGTLPAGLVLLLGTCNSLFS